MTDENGKIFENLSEVAKAYEQMDKELADMVEWCDPLLKLAVTQWVFKHVVEHGKDGGSYRYLIYDRLGFEMDAYGELLDDGMTISNEFDLNLKDAVIKAYKNGDEKKLKDALGLCDEPGCFNYVSCGWPSDNGYRSTCSDHSQLMKKKP